MSDKKEQLSKPASTFVLLVIGTVSCVIVYGFAYLQHMLPSFEIPAEHVVRMMLQISQILFGIVGFACIGLGLGIIIGSAFDWIFETGKK